MFDKIPKGHERLRESVQCNCLHSGNVNSGNVNNNHHHHNTMAVNQSKICSPRKLWRSNLIHTTDITSKVTEMNKKDFRLVSVNGIHLGTDYLIRAFKVSC